MGLAHHLFYGASTPAVLLVCWKKKPSERHGKVLIVNGDATFQPGKAQKFLTDEHVRTLAATVHAFAKSRSWPASLGKRRSPPRVTTSTSAPMSRLARMPKRSMSRRKSPSCKT